MIDDKALCSMGVYGLAARSAARFRIYVEITAKEGDTIMAGLGTALSRMVVGYNYPWAFNKYGLYFGPHPAEPWMDRWLDLFEKNLVEIGDLGLKVLRIFLLCGGENYGTLPSRPLNGRAAFEPPRPIDAKFLEDLERMLSIVRSSKTGIKLVPSLVDFGFFGPIYGNSGGRRDIARMDAAREAFFETALDPFLAVGKSYADQIYAWEVINEPYWNCHFISPPLYRSWRALPRIPLVRASEMKIFLTHALRRIEAAGFESTVGHRFYRDLKLWPGGTRPQFHYYAKQFLWFADPGTIPEHAETAGAFIGEIDAGIDHGKPWPELNGVDRDPERRIFERLLLLERKGYKLTLIWPELGWSAPNETDPLRWQERLADPLKITEQTKQGIKRFTQRSGALPP